ncbi:MAG: GTPase ObgE [Rhodobiaceae bacterium]|jgi:GTP-binding protein|nr:GTPase ObgE [Rhodobiaceae bacterium]MBT6223200.1 GTPase ObgE [Rhodobiaceae bacterium]
MKFLDEAKVYAKAGHGGGGCLSFRKEKYIEYGGPNGGDGGKGGDVWVTATEGLNTLIDYRYQQHYKGEKGKDGAGNNKSGRNGKDVTLVVPVGTQVFDEEREELIADLTEVGQSIKIATGGNGGWGNTRFKSSTNRAPRNTNPGAPGDELIIRLKLKLIADVGIVGLPNAGKSTLLSKVSAARPKIANYPFTTLTPALGVAEYNNKSFVLADIPGLIEGAHTGTGLGDKFLAHIERCPVLVHLISITDKNLKESYKIIRNEVASYGNEIQKKPEIIVINKCDIMEKEDIDKKLKSLKTLKNKELLLISAYTGEGIDKLKTSILKVMATENQNKASGSKEKWQP